jgi:hypothetical protein
MKRMLRLSILFWGALVANAFAGSSVSPEKILKLLEGDKQLHQFILDSFELDRVGWGSRIGTYHKYLGGARTGPYTINVRPKGSDGPWMFALNIEVVTRYSDDKGQEVPFRGAQKMEEKLKGVTLYFIGNEKAEQEGADPPATVPEPKPSGEQKSTENPKPQRQ